MKDFLKSKVVTIVILLATLILAGIAIFTAVRLYQLRQQAVAPNAPESKPAAATPSSCQALTFTLTVTCNQTCGGLTGTICPTGLVCIYSNGTTTAPNPDAQGNCRNPDCNTETDCVCGTGTPTATPTSTPTGTPTPSGTPNSCNGTCGSDSNCNSGLVCSGGYCRNSSCTSETDCTCPTTTPTSTATGTPIAQGTTTPAPSLPTAGTNWPTILGVGTGVILLFGALLLAL